TRRRPLKVSRPKGSALDGQPAGMIGAFVFKTAGEKARIAPIRVHYPNFRHAAGLRATANHPLAARRFAGAEVPDRRLTAREARYNAILRIVPTNLDAAARLIRLELTI